MAKAIKHITAGLLHVEVLGRVPQPDQRRRRSPRSASSSAAQQFYNNKASWRELELMTASNFGRGDYVAVLTYDDAHLPADKRAASKDLKKLFRRVRTARRRKGDELKYIYCTEGFHGSSGDQTFGGDGALENRRIHHHVILNGGLEAVDELRSLWHGGGYVRAEPLDVHFYQALAKYLTKEAREFGRPKPGERSWRASRSLVKYQVEYIEIPTDSITLAPPHGAVDYFSFHEKNPYGFSDCVGARYLLYPESDEVDYSYARGR